MELNTVVAVLLAVVALVALYAAMRVNGRGEAGRRATPGYVVFALAAAVMAWNLFNPYSTALAVVATVGMLAGLVVITRAWGARAGAV
jgi:uncharacterized membrane protein YcaP (DUF421 family)